MNLDALALAAARGDPRARKQLALWLRRSLLAYFGRRFQDQDVEDLCQQTAVVVFAGLPEFEHRGPGSFAAWVRRIAHNRKLQHANRQKREQRHFEPLDDSSPGPEVQLRERLHWRGRLELIRAGLGRINPLFSEALQHLLTGGDPAVLARKHGVTPHTIQTRASRAISQLRADIRAHYQSTSRFFAQLS